MIAGKHNDGVLCQPESFQCVEDATDAVVNHADHAVGQGRGFPRFLFGNGKAGWRIPQGVGGAEFFEDGLHVRRGVVMRVAPGWRQLDVFRLILIEILAWRIEWMVRIRVRTEEKKRRVRAVGGVVFEGLYCLFGDKRGRIQLFRHPRAPGLRDVQRTIGRQGIFWAAESLRIRVTFG